MGRAHMVFNGSAIQWPRVEVAAGIGSEFTKQRNTCALPPNRSHPARSIKILLHTLRELLLGVHDQANDVCRMLVNQRQEFVGFFVTSQGILNFLNQVFYYGPVDPKLGVIRGGIAPLTRPDIV
jgi:hypothetical protein